MKAASRSGSKRHVPVTILATILVIGATGTVGREVLRALRARPEVPERASVRVLLRKTPPASSLGHGVDVVAGDLGDPAAVERALEGVDAAFYLSPHHPDEERLAKIFVDACVRRNVRLVFVGVHVDGRTRFHRALKRMAFGMILGHYRPKLRLSEAVRQAHPGAVILMPTNFYQNDEMVLDVIQGGVYPLTLGRRGVNRIDVRDLADAAARALLDHEVLPGAHPIVGPATLSGIDSAAVWSDVLGRPVQYDDDDDRFSALLRERLSGKKLDDVLASYRALSKLHVPTLPEDVAATERLLGRPARAYAEYVRDQVAASKSAA